MSYLVAELIVNPLGEFPLNDDWSYTKSVLTLYNEGRVDIGDWPAMTLVTHLVWGFLFVKTFGFSFFILRVSTWVSVSITIWTFNKLILKISNNGATAFVACLTLIFSPLYFNTSNTFMTDVNFVTLIVLACYFAHDFFSTKKFSSFLLVYFLSALLILLRQYGIIVPACMTFTCLFLTENKKMYFITGSLLSLVVYVIFESYEEYLETILSPGAAYKYSGYINPMRRLFWDYLWYGITTRYKIITIHAMFYTFPLAVIFLPAIFQATKKYIFFSAALVIFAAVYFLYRDYPLQVGNVFLDTAVGADTSYETLIGTFAGHPHFFSATFFKIITPFKYILISISLLCIVLFTRKVLSLRTNPFKANLPLVFFVSLFLSYCVMILITESFFDRYQMPVIALALVGFGYLNKIYLPKFIWSALPLFALFYISVFGTKDYFTWNKKKWEAYHYLVNEKKVDHANINAGFEVSCWNEGGESALNDFLVLDSVDYLVQYKPEPGFILMKEYPFRKYFPLKKDTLRIYQREVK